MERVVTGDVVVVAFPHSDLSGEKKRPALVLAQAEFGNVILCQITSKPYSSTNSIKITSTDFKKGGLPVPSYIRPDKIFTAEPKIIQKVAGKLKDEKRKLVLTQVKQLFNG